jgi:hypothetical protein
MQSVGNVCKLVMILQKGYALQLKLKLVVKVKIRLALVKAMDGEFLYTL